MKSAPVENFDDYSTESRLTQARPLVVNRMTREVPHNDSMERALCAVADLPAIVERSGFALLCGVIDLATCALIARRVKGAQENSVGSRGWLVHPWCVQLAMQLKTHPRIAPALPVDPVAVQCTAFSKTAASNWLVALHQDRSIPVKTRVRGGGLVGWSEKEGGLFVQPPRSVLEQMTAVRLHVDPCPPDSGPLRVVPGSHAATQGSTLIMKPLLLHASSKASVPSRRLVLHFLFGPRCLPCGLEWQNAI